MWNLHKLLVIGGDRRQLYMACALQARGYSVRLCGFGENEGFHQLQFCTEGFEEAIRSCHAVILPLPASRDGVLVNAPFTNSPPALESIRKSLHREQVLFAGMLSPEWQSRFFGQGVQVFDYFEREELTVRNAIPTAQGVLKVAMDHIEFTLHGASCLITGYGRCARALAFALKGLGAHVSIAARKVRDLAFAQAEGCEGIYLEDLPRYAGDFDLLVNTIPAQVVTQGTLQALRKDCLLIEIASSPFGIDFTAAEALGLKVIVAPSLPGKVAPKTAGEIISDAIHNIIKEGSPWTKLQSALP